MERKMEFDHSKLSWKGSARVDIMSSSLFTGVFSKLTEEDRMALRNDMLAVRGEVKPLTVLHEIWVLHELLCRYTGTCRLFTNREAFIFYFGMQIGHMVGSDNWFPEQ